MPVLLLRLAAPMQSWGLQSRFSVRDTAREPTKSGVIGLVCAAVGTPREDDETVARLAAMRFGVRVNREGREAVDFQTIGGGHILGRRYGVAQASGGQGAAVVSPRAYLAEADFLAGLEDDDHSLLLRLGQALSAPRWPLFLGRRAFPPAVPVGIGVVKGPLRGVLRTWPYPLADEIPVEGLRLVLERGGADVPEGELRYDVPISFAPERRAYLPRYVVTQWLPPELVRR